MNTREEEYERLNKLDQERQRLREEARKRNLETTKASGPTLAQIASGGFLVSTKRTARWEAR